MSSVSQPATSTTVTGTVTANQGTAGSPWPTKVTDGTNTAPVTNAAPAVGDYGLNVRVVSQPAGASGGGPADVGATTAASETDATRQKTLAAIRLLDTSLAAGSQLVALKGDSTSGAFVQVKNTPAVTNANLDVALSTRTKPADQQHTIIDSGTTVVTQPTGTNLHMVVDSAPTTAVTGTFWQATQPVSGAVAVSSLPATPAGTNVIGHVIVDTAPTTTVTGTVTANQGTNNATPWNENLSQFGGAAVTLAQKAAASSIPVVLANDANGATQATALFHQSRALNTFTATYRLAARPYALSFAISAGTRKQYATIHHPSTSTKTVKLKRVELALESSSVAAIIVADLVRITTAPATGNPAITPTAAAFADGVADSVCLALPTTAATEAGLQSMQEWNLGITGTGSVINPPPGLNWYTLWPQTQGASEAAEDKFPTIRPSVLEGYAVTIDSSAASTVKGYVVIEFTEE